MREFIVNLSSVYWWISVVIVGVLINIVSAYLKTKLDTYLSGTSSWWKKRLEKRQAHRQELIDKIRSDSDKRNALTNLEITDRLQALQFYLVGYGTGFLGVSLLFATKLLGTTPRWILIFAVFVILVACVAILLGMNFFRSANHKRRLIREAQKNKDLNEEDIS